MEIDEIIITITDGFTGYHCNYMKLHTLNTDQWKVNNKLVVLLTSL